MKEESTIVIDLAKELIELAHRLEPNWSKAFYRFCFEEHNHGSNASYIGGVDVVIIDPFKNSSFFGSMNAKSVRLLESLGKNQAVFVLTVDSTCNYDIKFEYEDMNRWKISKISGGTGIPEGF